MNIQALFSEAKAVRVRLFLQDGKVKMSGPDEARAALRPRLAPHKAEILAYLIAAEQQAGEFWPWAPYLTSVDVERFRTELVSMIEKLACMEQWPTDHRDDILTRAIRGPLADLLPNLHHFNERLKAASTETVDRRLASSRAWRYDR